MDNNTYFLEIYAEMRREEFEEAARVAQLIREINAEKPKFWPKLAKKVRGWRVALSHRLREVAYGTAQFGPQHHDLPPK
jgi:hypothetical protein